MNIIGADPSQSFTATELQNTGKGFGLGDRFTANDGKEYVFVLAGVGGITGAGYVGIIDEAYSAVMATLTTSATAFGDMVGVGVAAIAASSYGWLQVKGPCVILGNALCAANVRINTTATAGQLDDDGTAGSEVVEGVALTAAVGGAAATAAAIISYPRIGATL
jgi:hypothetical protein